MVPLGYHQSRWEQTESLSPTHHCTPLAEGSAHQELHREEKRWPFSIAEKLNFFN